MRLRALGQAPPMPLAPQELCSHRGTRTGNRVGLWAHGGRHTLGTGAQQASGVSGPGPDCRASWSKLAGDKEPGGCRCQWLPMDSGSDRSLQAPKVSPGQKGLFPVTRRPRTWKGGSGLMPLTSQSSLICEMGTMSQVASVSTRLGTVRAACPTPVLSTVGSLGPAAIPGHRHTGV